MPRSSGADATTGHDLPNMRLVEGLRKVFGMRKACVSPERRAELEERLEFYETACKLSRGPDAGRSKHWLTRARDIEAGLLNALESITRAW